MAKAPKKVAPQEVDAYDNSEIETYCKCERMHYYRYVRSLIKDAPRKQLSFGSAWHSAMDAVWQAICWDKITDEMEAASLGVAAFLEKYTEEGFPDVDEWSRLSKEEQKFLEPHSPVVGMEMVYAYVQERRPFLQGIELLEIEKPFIVPIDPNDATRMYAGRMDKVYRRNSRIYGVDHKSTGMYAKEGVFRSTYIDGFNPNRQLEGYLHSLKMKYGKEAKAVWADCALVHRTEHSGFRFVPVELQWEQLESWLWETHERIDAMSRDRDRLLQGRADGSIFKTPSMRAYPKKPEACTLYGAPCSYIDLCRAWANPELHPGVPPGYKEDKWSPFTEYQLDKMGLVPKAIPYLVEKPRGKKAKKDG